MCSVGDDNLDVQVSSTFTSDKKVKISADTKCNKCRTEKPQVVLRNKDAYCKSCFLASTTHKFKALLGKSRLVSPNERVLVCYKGGHPSTALLHMLRSGLDLTTPKKLRFEPIVLFVEDNFNLKIDERYSIVQKVNEEITGNNFPAYFVSLVKYMSDPMELSNHLHENFNDLKVTEEDEDVLQQIIDENVNLTTKQDLLQMFEHQLVTDVAKILNCQCVFLTDIAVDTASHLLTNISLGRGAHLELDIGMCDNRDEKVKIIKPLRMFDIKELAFYNIFNNLEPISIQTIPQNPYDSVKHLIEKFVADLQVNYPATITTVLRTGDKLAMDREMLKNDRCLLCKAPVENNRDTLSSAEATRFSHFFSTSGHTSTNSSNNSYETALQSFSNNLNLKYCYACSKIVHHLKR